MAVFIWNIVDGSGVTHVIENVKGCDVFTSDRDRPLSFLTGNGESHEARLPTCEGVLHPYDTRIFLDKEEDNE